MQHGGPDFRTPRLLSEGIGVIKTTGGDDAIFFRYSGKVIPGIDSQNRELAFVITGGKGRFAGATGSGVFRETVDFSMNKLTRTLEGKIVMETVMRETDVWEGEWEGVGSPTPIERAARIVRRAEVVLVQARETRLAARIARGKARMTREARQSREGLRVLLPPLEYILPPVDYVLPPLNYALPPLSEGLEGEEWRAEPSGEIRFIPATAPSTTLYVWGYELALSVLCREQCETTATAARFAAASGWEEWQPGAWAKEIHLPCGLWETIRTLEPILRQDPGVVGWGLRMQRRRK